MIPTPTLNDDLIKPDEIKLALATSGYPLEGRIGHVLEDQGFYVELNSFRADPRDENKSIEVDVVGRLMETINEQNRSSVVAEALIECKNNSQPVVFFLKNQSVPEINDNYIRYAGYPASSADPESNEHIPLRKLLAMKDWHHYCSASEVATQFCGFSKQKQGGTKEPTPHEDWRWKAESMENYSKSFANLCVATACAGVGSFETDQQNIQLEFYYPLIVFQGPLYKASLRNGNIDLQLTSHLQFHHSASVAGRVIRAQIDVVSEDGLPALIRTIQEEVKRTADGIKGIEQRLLASAIDQKRVASQREPVASFGPIGEGRSQY